MESMITDAIESVQAQGDCLTGISKFLQTCRSLNDVKNMGRFLKYFTDRETATWGNDELDRELLEFGARLAAGEDLDMEGDKTTSARGIGSEIYYLLSCSEDSDIDYLQELLRAIGSGRENKNTLRDSVAAFLKHSNAPAPKSTRVGRAKKAA